MAEPSRPRVTPDAASLEMTDVDPPRPTSVNPTTSGVTAPANGFNGNATHTSEKRHSGDDDWDGSWDNGEFPEEEDELVLEEDPEEMAVWSGQASIKGGTDIIRMMLLTFNTMGMTFTWGVEMSYCTPYLLSLGLTKGQTSMVWIVGPLSGLVVQPIVGVISDQSRSRWGRRRPFIFVCSCIVSCGLLTLGFTKEVITTFVSDPDAARILTIVLAVLALYATDFAINAVMSCSRSLVVDTLPIQKQQAGAAWGGRMASVGHLIGYSAGGLDLVKIFGGALGDTQFKILTVIAAAGILLTSCVTCWAVSERVLLSQPNPKTKGRADAVRFPVVRQIWSTLVALPPRMQAICWAVFWSWIGWYPFLIYSSTWVGETYFRFDAPAAGADPVSKDDALGDMGRVGSSALTFYSAVTFLGAWILPLLVRSPEDSGSGAAQTPEWLARLGQRFGKLRKPNLLSVWLYSNLIFAAAMSLAPFAASYRFATFLVAVCGIPWTIAMWAPAAFLGVEVNKLTGATVEGAGAAAAYRRLSAESADAVEMAQLDDTAAPHAPSAESRGEPSGVYFGILNLYSTIPQFMATFISTIVFGVLEPGKSPELATGADPSEHHGTDGPNAIAVCLFIGAVSALGAAYATRKLRFIA